MIEASPLAASPLSAPSLSATLVRRRRPLMLAPPTACRAMPVDTIEIEAEATWPTWREDLRFFLACYAAGVVFFLIMLS